MKVMLVVIVLLSFFSRPGLSFLPHPLLQSERFVSSTCTKVSPSWTTLAAKRIPRTTNDIEQNGSKTIATPKRPQRSSVTTPTRAPHQFDHRLELARPFLSDVRTEIQKYKPNDDAPVLDLSSILPDQQSSQTELLGEHIPDDLTVAKNPIETLSLDKLFPGLQFSKHFAESADFRNALRMAIREDVFDTTELYHSLSEKAKRVLLLPDASLQGSWKCHNGHWRRKLSLEEACEASSPLRMIQLTAVLQKYLGSNAPSGDLFMDTMGALCGSSREASWTDVVGVSNRRVPHSWQLDACPSKSVLLGFPPLDNYSGLGVFPHFVKLADPFQRTASEADLSVALDSNLQIDENFIVRPLFAPHQEILIYSNRDVLCSEPDISYRTSCMRFS
jgi:hypothetical protein